MEKSPKITDSDFLYWLVRRLQNLHNYTNDNEIINRLQTIANNLSNISIQISDNDIDKIICQYFIDFNLDKDEYCNLGYSTEERTKLRNSIKQISVDIFSKNVPKDFLLK